MLRAAGLSQAQIAVIEGISECSVRKICGGSPIVDPRDVALARERGSGATQRGGTDSGSRGGRARG